MSNFYDHCLRKLKKDAYQEVDVLIEAYQDAENDLDPQEYITDFPALLIAAIALHEKKPSEALAKWIEKNIDMCEQEANIDLSDADRAKFKQFLEKNAAQKDETPPLLDQAMQALNIQQADQQSLYQVPANQRKKLTIQYQKFVNDKFFRLLPGQTMKANSTSLKIFQELEAIHSANKRHASTVFYITNAITLDGRYPRSVIIALSHFIRKYHVFPMSVFKIGDTLIKCTPAESGDPGNLQIQTINAYGKNFFSPSKYSEEEINDPLSIAQALEKTKIKTNIHEDLRNHNTPINTTKDEFLDHVNFLRAIIEVARYTHPKSKLSKLPIASAQARTSSLLIDKKIVTHEAYGIDRKEEFYNKNKLIDVYGGTASEVDVHRAPYGAVTGTGLNYHIETVEEKIHRINEKYGEQYAQHPSHVQHMALIEGCKLHRNKLAEEFGDGNESDGSDYSNGAPNLPQGSKKVALK